MTLTREHFSLNTLQWITVGLGDASGEPGEVGWEFDLSTFLPKQPVILGQVKEAGFSSVMLEVLPTQTLQSYARVVADSGLRLSPGYVHIGLPEDFGRDHSGDAEAHFRWFDAIRRRAEETTFMGLDRVFLAADMAPGRPRIDVAAAVGHEADRARLDRVANIIGETAEVLKAEGVTPALHNHVGTWIETEEEYDYVLDAVPASLLAAGPDIGHLAWTGADVVGWIAGHAERISDLHVKDMDLSIAAATRAARTPYFDVMARRFFLEPGLGDVPIAEALAGLPEGFSGDVIIEVDKPSMEPFASAKTSWAWIAANYPEAS
ncbi:sugar phosphate isomerase/epimerase family protein [Microbacterium hydrocarbonoxydans]|uniref:sugar phosphate isomerase/epimerase family protein n=1 Tax=Microbacterium hydrocarbonoxydans TaxID=273678 RepID=UPI0007BAFC24|nr:sugar phosphate isomerase/epimerase [Microbacterium hydrocarbonoxydans]GAT75012.1 xylose isomerase domain protein TIM barrel [Microbacterium sp. HM58-2]